jgi:ATP-dependent Clp protease protease subunit
MEMGSLPTPLERTIYFNKQVEQETIEEVTKQIIDINQDDEMLRKMYKNFDLKYKPKPIKIMISSYGGDVYQILSLIAIIEKSKTPVHTIATGAAMSCGFILLISGHKRFAYKYATPMYHQVSSFSIGTLKDIQEDMDETERLQKLLEKITIEKTKITKEKLKKVYKTKHDWFMTAEEAKEFGVIDEII